MMWLFEQYELHQRTISSLDFDGDLASKFDVIVLPAGTSRRTIVEGLDSRTNDESWRWAFGVGEKGWRQLEQWVRQGGTLVAVGSAVATARELLDLPIEGVLPQQSRGRGGQTARAGQVPQVPATEVRDRLRSAFQSPANLLDTLKNDVVPSNALFFCPGSLLRNEFDTGHPIAFGMPAEWPVFFRYDQAYRLKPSFGTQASVVSRYPTQGPIVASGWLLGEDMLRDQANVLAFQVDRGTVVALGSQVAFRTQPRATFKLLFNAIFQGPAASLDSGEIAAKSGSRR
jgi:hypothetical protein